MAGRAEARDGGDGVLPPTARPTCCGSLGARGRCGLGEASAEVVAEGTAGAHRHAGKPVCGGEAGLPLKGQDLFRGLEVR